jgi:hypothetical protein
MRRIFADFEVLALEDDPSRPGVFLKARKPTDWVETDLSTHALHSIVTGTRVVAHERSDFRTLRHARSVALDRLKGWVTGAGQRLLHGR